MSARRVALSASERFALHQAPSLTARHDDDTCPPPPPPMEVLLTRDLSEPLLVQRLGDLISKVLPVLS